MELKIRDETYNPLLKRKELLVEISNAAGGTPQRYEVRKSIAARLGAKTENVLVVRMDSATGSDRTSCFVEVYDDAESAKRTVPQHLQIRNLSPEERAKKLEEAKKPEAKEEPKPAAKKPRK